MALDPDALLCERCGYALTGLPPEGACPECAKPIADSLPARRSGTPWQRGPGLRAWLATIVLPPREPLGMWERVSVGTPHTSSLLMVTLLAAAAILAGWIALWDGFGVAGRAVAATLITGALFGALLIATRIEMLGIRFFGRNHGWRITDDVALAVCAHAAPGWFAGALLFILSDVTLRLLTITRLNPAALLPAALLGLIGFEALVYIGMRRMKFANRPGAGVT